MHAEDFLVREPQRNRTGDTAVSGALKTHTHTHTDNKYIFFFF